MSAARRISSPTAHLFFTAKLRAAGLVVGSSVMVAAAAWLITADPDLLTTRHPEVLFASCLAGMVLYGVLAVRWTRALFRVYPVLEIDPDGILDRRLGPHPVPWSSVHSVQLVRAGRRPVLALSVDPPAGALECTPGMRRYFVGGKDGEGRRTVHIGLTGLNAPPEAVLAAVEKALIARNRTYTEQAAA